MKKRFILVFVMSLFFSFSQSVFSISDIYESNDIRVVINGKIVELENPLIIKEGRTLLPLRELATFVGINEESILWNEKDRSIILKNGINEVYLKIGSKDAKINFETVEIDVPPFIYKDRTYIPVRFVSQSLNKVVGWDSITRTVTIQNRDTFDKISKILKNTTDSMNSKKSFRRNDISKVKFVISDVKKEISTVIRSEFDINSKVAYSRIHRNTFESDNTIEVFTKEFKQKMRVDNSEWNINEMEKIDFDNEFVFNELISENNNFSGLFISEENEESTIIEGDIDIKSYSIGAIALEELVNYNMKEPTIKIEINKKDYSLKKILMSFSIPYINPKTKNDINFDFKIITEFFDYDIDLKISEPK